MMADTGTRHSSAHRCVQTILPPVVHRFLFSQSEEFPVARPLFRALFGVATGTGNTSSDTPGRFISELQSAHVGNQRGYRREKTPQSCAHFGADQLFGGNRSAHRISLSLNNFIHFLFLGIAHNLPLTFDLKVAVGCLFVAVCLAGGLLSSSFRCSVLLVFPSMLGSRGRSYLILLALSVLYAGPVSNIQRNVEAAAVSVSCNLDLQVRHSKLLWREAIKPFLIITQELMDNKEGFELEALNVSKKFQDIRDEMVLQYGYDRFETKQGGGNSTQEEFTAKTLKQCDSVVAQGVQRCVDWFANRWTACLEAIPVPVINYILCISMKFHFLCDIMKVMTPWCRDNIPVEGNFGQLFDRLNVSVDLLSREFSAELTVEEEEQPALSEALLDQQFTNAVKTSFQKLTSTTGRVLNILQMLLSLTFITFFTQAFGYLWQYNRDICFDNVYITTYFRQIDARRRKAGKRCLLPLRKSEKNKLINPCSLKIYPEEVKQVVRSRAVTLAVFM
uniref:DC-STAMP domain containing 1 n=1 Tax=Maylandia zebra TaxID=106582 RepID=A0A3P9CL19_9CICH